MSYGKKIYTTFKNKDNWVIQEKKTIVLREEESFL